MSVLEAATTALRDGAPSPDARAEATRARLVRSLERRTHRRRQMMAAVTVLVVMLGATASWAWSTGRLQALFGRGAVPHETTPIDRPAPATDQRGAVDARAAAATSSVVPVPAPILEAAAAASISATPAPIGLETAAPSTNGVERAAPAPQAWPAPAETTPPRPLVAKRSRPVKPAEVLYRRAHDLHFHGDDHIAALAAWDAYLAAESTGTFAIEARFNRGLVLSRLARYSEAIVALEPFAKGEVADGYRRDEAAALVTRLRALIEAP